MRLLDAVEILAEGGDAEGGDAAALEEDTEGGRSGLHRLQVLRGAPLAHLLVEPAHVDPLLRLYAALRTVGVGHHALDRAVDDALLARREPLEDRGLVTQLAPQVIDDRAGDVATLDGLAIHVLVERRGGGAEHRVVEDIDRGRVAGVGEIVHAILRS